jgi:glycosyltransferase involved in cell wall biosynthesis
VTAPGRVSVIVIFLNGARFIEEAVDSVFAQTYPDWELLLVDDGSTDASTGYARDLADRHPDRVRYLEHSGHENRGMSASRNLGLAHAGGEFVALLDADDVWLPGKLAAQVAALRTHPEAGMVYGSALYWYSWAGDQAEGVDTLMLSRVRAGRVYRPARLLPGFLTGAAMVPCPSCVLVRREVMQAVGGFEPEFRTLYEDQVFFAKMALHTPILVSEEHWLNYRQHPDSACAREGSGTFPDPARLRFLDWLERYLNRNGLRRTRVLRTLRRERWLQQHPAAGQAAVNLRRWARRWRRRLMPWTAPHSVPMAPVASR